MELVYYQFLLRIIYLFIRYYPDIYIRQSCLSGFNNISFIDFVFSVSEILIMLTFSMIEIFIMYIFSVSEIFIFSVNETFIMFAFSVSEIFIM